MLELLAEIMRAFGAFIIVPVVLAIIALFMGVKPKKAVQSGINAGIGLIGFSFLINAYVPIVTPVIHKMVNETGIKLPVFDIGWQATSVVAYSTEVGMIFLGLGLLLQTVLYLVKWTNVFMPSDLWNNYSFMLWGSMLYIATGNMWLSILLMVLMNLYLLCFSEIVAKRWSTYYKYPNCTITAPHHLGSVPVALAMDWFLNKLGLDKIKLNPDTLQEKIGFLGEPTQLGLILGLILGFVGNLSELNTLKGWGQIATIGMATAAVMAIFPRVAGIFASAFSSITDASKKTLKKSNKNQNDTWFLAINDAAGYGESATLLTGMLLIPIMVIIAVIAPGNGVLPMVDLIAIPYMIEVIIAVSNGNILKSLISGAVWCTGGLYVITAVAPVFTSVAQQVGVDMAVGAMFICSFAVMTNWTGGLMFMLFLTQNPLYIGLAVVFYFIMYVMVRKNRNRIYDYLERQALGDEYVPETES